MKLNDTITVIDRINLLRGDVVGVFKSIIQPSDAYYGDRHHMCIGYYMGRSGEKTVSTMYDKLLESVLSQYDEHTDENIVLAKEEVNTLIGTAIRHRYKDKWDKVYQYLVRAEYDALNNHDFTETDNRSGSEENQYDSSVIDDGKTSMKETSTRTLKDDTSVYGFNSSSPINDSDSVETADETTIGLADDNTNYNKRSKTGKDTLITSNTSTKTSKGRNASGASMIEEELKLRDMHNFYSIVYRDIDNMLTTPLYF